MHRALRQRLTLPVYYAKRVLAEKPRPQAGPAAAAPTQAKKRRPVAFPTATRTAPKVRARPRVMQPSAPADDDDDGADPACMLATTMRVLLRQTLEALGEEKPWMREDTVTAARSVVEATVHLLLRKALARRLEALTEAELSRQGSIQVMGRNVRGSFRAWHEDRAGSFQSDFDDVEFELRYLAGLAKKPAAKPATSAPAAGLAPEDEDKRV